MPVTGNRAAAPHFPDIVCKDNIFLKISELFPWAFNIGAFAAKNFKKNPKLFLNFAQDKRRQNYESRDIAEKKQRAETIERRIQVIAARKNQQVR